MASGAGRAACYAQRRGQEEAAHSSAAAARTGAARRHHLHQGTPRPAQDEADVPRADRRDRPDRRRGRARESPSAAATTRAAPRRPQPAGVRRRRSPSRGGSMSRRFPRATSTTPSRRRAAPTTRCLRSTTSTASPSIRCCSSTTSSTAPSSSSTATRCRKPRSTSIVAWYSEDPNGLIVAPLPELEDKIAVTAWTHLMKCPAFSEEAFDEFTESTASRAPSASAPTRCSRAPTERQRIIRRTPGWRNGRRGGLKILCPQGHMGSTPIPGIADLQGFPRHGPRISGASRGAVTVVA